MTTFILSWLAIGLVWAIILKFMDAGSITIKLFIGITLLGYVTPTFLFCGLLIYLAQTIAGGE